MNVENAKHDPKHAAAFEGLKKQIAEGAKTGERQAAPPAATNEPEPEPEPSLEQGEEKPAELETPAEPTGTEEPQQDEQAVPYDRFKTVNDQKKANEERATKAEQEAQELRAELTKLQEAQADTEREAKRQALLHGERPEGWSEMSSDAQMLWMAEQVASTQPQPKPDTSQIAELEARLERLQAESLRSEVSKATGVTDPEALEAVIAMAHQNQDLSPDQVVGMAKIANPHLSWDAASSEPVTVPASHVGTVPTRSTKGRSNSTASRRREAFEAVRSDPSNKQAAIDAAKHILKL